MIHDPQDIFTADFGEEITLHTTGGDRKIIAIYDDAFMDQTLGETVMDTTQKRFTAREADAVGLRREDTITHGTQEFTVIQIQPDGTGFVTISVSNG